MLIFDVSHDRKNMALFSWEINELGVIVEGFFKEYVEQRKRGILDF